MTLTQTTQSQTIFPDYIRDQPVVDKEGNLSELWNWGLGFLFQALQDNFKNEGIVVPGLTLEQMATIAGAYAAYIGGQLPQDQTPASQNIVPNISGQFAYCKDTKFYQQFVVAYNTASPPQITLAQWVPLAVMLSGAVNPNGQQAGLVSWQYLNTATNVMWVCTTAGSANGTPAPQAVWTAL